MSGPLIIVGGNLDAATRSAERAGYVPYPIAIPEGGDATAQVLRNLSEAPAAAPVLLTIEVEHHPELIEALAFNRKLLGPSHEAIQQVADPKCLASLPTIPGVVVRRSWIQRLLRWMTPRDEPSTPIEAVFSADGWSSRFLGAVHRNDRAVMELDETQRAALSHLGVVLCQRHDLRGLFAAHAAIDKRGAIQPQRILPWYTDAVDALEQSTGLAALKVVK